MRLYCLRVELLEVTPPVWRRIELPAKSSLAELHLVLQLAMGWKNYHLHEFEVGDRRYGGADPEFDGGEVLDETALSLEVALPERGTSLVYVYDFGDNWKHAVTLEKIVASSAESSLTRVLDGERACPPEDAGGAQAYERLLEALRNPIHRQHKEFRAWTGTEFDPEEFSAEKINRLLQKKHSRKAVTR